MASKDVQVNVDRKALQHALRPVWNALLNGVLEAGEEGARRDSRVDTASYRDAWHRARPGYDWAGDAVEANPDHPVRSGRDVEPEWTGDTARLELGNGQSYAANLELMDDTLGRQVPEMRAALPRVARQAARRLR